jgi:hypothetical protein
VAVFAVQEKAIFKVDEFNVKKFKVSLLQHKPTVNF